MNVNTVWCVVIEVSASVMGGKEREWKTKRIDMLLMKGVLLMLC